MVFKENFVKLVQSKVFKRITLILGIILLLATAFISINPAPFLKFGYSGVFLFNLFGPGSLLVPALALKMNIISLAFISSVGMAFNDSLSWLIGKIGNDVIPHTTKIEKIENQLKKHGVYYLFLWSLIPFPYDIIGFIAGYLDFRYLKFVLPTFFGRFIRFIVIGYSVVNLI